MYWFQHNFQIAALRADLRNFFGGKREKPQEPGSDPPLQPHELYSPLEMLQEWEIPYWARPEYQQQQPQTPQKTVEFLPIPAPVAQGLVMAYEAGLLLGPVWARLAEIWDRIERSAGGNHGKR